MQSEKTRTVAFIESASSMGGVQFSTLYLAKSLDPARWNPIVVCPEEGDMTRACRDAGIETVVLNQPRLWATSIRIGRNARLPNPFAWIVDATLIGLALRRLKRFLTKRSPDLLVTKGLSSHFAGGLAARLSGIPAIWHVQDFISERNFGLYLRIFGLAARLPRHIVVDGASIAEQLPRSLKPRVSVVLNGVDTDLFHPGLNGADVRRELGIPENDLVIGHAARITPWKGQHYLIEAFARIANEHPNVSVLIAGAPVFDNDVYQRRLLRMTAELGLQDRIKFAGYRHDLPNVLAAMDVFAFTSIEKDTSPLALLSAFSTGLPVVAFEIAGVRELIDAGASLVTAPVENVDDLAKGLSALIRDRERRLSLSKSARQFAEDKLSLSMYVDNLEEAFLKVESRAQEICEVTKQAVAGSVRPA